MDVEFGGNIMFDFVEKGAELGRTVTGFASANDFAGLTAVWAVAAAMKAANKVVVPWRS